MVQRENEGKGMKSIPTEARLDALELRVNTLEIKNQEMKEKIHYFSYEMAKYFRKYNKLEQKLEIEAIKNICSRVKIVINNEIKESLSDSDYGIVMKELINKWFNEQIQNLTSHTSPVMERMDKIEQNFLDYIRYFEQQKNMNIIEIKEPAQLATTF